MLVIVAGSTLVNSVEDGIVSMGLHMLLQILRTLEGLATKLASMRFQWYMDSNVRGNMIAFDDLDIAVSPGASQIQVVSALAADVFIANVILGTVSFSISVDERNQDLHIVVLRIDEILHNFAIGNEIRWYYLLKG